MNMTARLLQPWTQHSPLALIAERDPDTRTLYAEYLLLSSCTIEQADDGRDALAKALARCPDVIVTDTRLPGISGFDLCKLLREDRATRSTAIVVVTGDALERDIHRAQWAGADSVLVKPCLPETLLAEIARVLDLSVELRERARRIRAKSVEQVGRATALIERIDVSRIHMTLARAHDRRDTAHPPIAPPPLVCPSCDLALRYQRSHIGGVSARHSEQWDYYDCPNGCGTFQYRQRTRKLRRVA
jgi:CheY-like chemotaxis protein